MVDFRAHVKKDSPYAIVRNGGHGMEFYSVSGPGERQPEDVEIRIVSRRECAVVVDQVTGIGTIWHEGQLIEVFKPPFHHSRFYERAGTVDREHHQRDRER